MLAMSDQSIQASTRLKSLHLCACVSNITRRLNGIVRGTKRNPVHPVFNWSHPNSCPSNNTVSRFTQRLEDRFVAGGIRSAAVHFAALLLSTAPPHPPCSLSHARWSDRRTTNGEARETDRMKQRCAQPAFIWLRTFLYDPVDATLRIMATVFSFFNFIKM